LFYYVFVCFLLHSKYKTISTVSINVNLNMDKYYLQFFLFLPRQNLLNKFSISRQGQGISVCMACRHVGVSVAIFNVLFLVKFDLSLYSNYDHFSYSYDRLGMFSTGSN